MRVKTENIENWLELFSRLNQDLSRKLCKISISFCAPVFFPLSLGSSKPKRKWAAGMSCCDASLHFTYLHFIKLSHAHHLQLHYNDPKKKSMVQEAKKREKRDGCGWKVKVDRFELDFFLLFITWFILSVVPMQCNYARRIDSIVPTFELKFPVQEAHSASIFEFMSSLLSLHGVLMVLTKGFETVAKSSVHHGNDSDERKKALLILRRDNNILREFSTWRALSRLVNINVIVVWVMLLPLSRFKHRCIACAREHCYIY